MKVYLKTNQPCFLSFYNSLKLYFDAQKMVYIQLILVVFLFNIPINIQAQTCCSGGVPLSGNIGLPASQANTFQFSASYDLNVLQTLKFGSETIEDASRTRTTHSGLIELGYTINKRFAVDGFFAFVRQERIIRQNGNTDFQSTQGIGDAVLLAKYNIIQKTELGEYTNWQVGIGPKIPFGKTNNTNDIGIVYNADLQPGSGAWDGVLWSNFAWQVRSRPQTTFSSTLSFAAKGVNDNYQGNQSYQFGNEFQFLAGFSELITLFKKDWDISLSGRYRWAGADKIDNNILSNTGGQWIFAVPRISWTINDMKWHINSELPVYTKIVGTQLSPTFRINTGVYYSIIPKKFKNKGK